MKVLEKKRKVEKKEKKEKKFNKNDIIEINNTKLNEFFQLIEKKGKINKDFIKIGNSRLQPG